MNGKDMLPACLMYIPLRLHRLFTVPDTTSSMHIFASSRFLSETRSSSFLSTPNRVRERPQPISLPQKGLFSPCADAKHKNKNSGTPQKYKKSRKSQQNYKIAAKLALSPRCARYLHHVQKHFWSCYSPYDGMYVVRSMNLPLVGFKTSKTSAI